MMTVSTVRVCQCRLCQQEGAPPERALHGRMNLFLSRLDEAQRRWYVALESTRVGYGGDRELSQITGLDEKTIRRGRDEVAASLADQPTERVRQPGGGAPRTEKKTPT